MNLSVHISGFGQMFGVPNAVVDQYLKLATPSQLKVLLYLLRKNSLPNSRKKPRSSPQPDRLRKSSPAAASRICSRPAKNAAR